MAKHTEATSAARQKAPKRLGGLSHWVPGIGYARTYKRVYLVFDLAAGLALGAILVPKGIAYAELAGLPAVTGLYSTVACLIAYAIMGPSRVLVIGPDSSVSPLIFAAIVPLAAGGDPSTAIALAGMLAIMVGIIEVGLGLGKLGFVADLLSQEVQVGYMNGLAVLIAVDMLAKFFGLTIHAEGTINKAVAVYHEIGATNYVSMTIGIVTLIVLLGFPFITKRVPSVIIGVGGALLATAVFGLAEYGVKTIGVLPTGFPTPSLPIVPVETLGKLAVAAFGIVLVSLADTMATSASFAARRGDEVDANQELIGVGFSNFAVGFFQGFPISVSGSRTAVATQSGAKTQLTNVIGAIVLLGLLVFFPSLLKDLPQPALAAVVIAAAIGLTDFGALRTYWRVRKSSLLISLAASFGVIIFGVLNGILIAVGISVILFFRRSWWPPGEVLAYDSTLDDWHSAKRVKDGTQAPGILVFRWEAPLFFANSGIFRTQIRKLVVQQQPEWIVLQCEAVTDIDVTAAGMLRDLDRELNAKGIHFAFVGMRDRLKDLLLDYGLMETLDQEHFYPSVRRALGAMERRRKASSVFLCSPVNALDEGIYRQSIPIKTLRDHGDFGVGTFDDLDGELLMLDGRAFQMTTGGHVNEVGEGAATPFACVTYFEPISHDDLEKEMDYQAFKDWMVDLLPSPNLFYALRIEGTFAEVQVTSLSRERSGRTLGEAGQEEPVITSAEVKGTLAGFYTPPFLKSLNRPGLQLSFLSADRLQGGRLVSCRPRSVRAQVQFITLVELGLPMSLGYLTWTFDEDSGAYLEHAEE